MLLAKHVGNYAFNESDVRNFLKECYKIYGKRMSSGQALKKIRLGEKVDVAKIRNKEIYLTLTNNEILSVSVCSTGTSTGSFVYSMQEKAKAHLREIK